MKLKLGIGSIGLLFFFGRLFFALTVFFGAFFLAVFRFALFLVTFLPLALAMDHPICGLFDPDFQAP